MKTEVKVGSLLISKPFIEDKRFEKTIILIVEHNYNGTIGFIMNKQTEATLDALIKKIPPTNIKIQYGGPVDNKESLFFIHKYPDLIRDSQEIKDGVFWGGETQDVIHGLESQEICEKDILFFTGYTGWEQDQLKYEIEEGSWIIHHIDLTKLHQQLNWSNILVEINKDYEVWATAPSDFHLN